MHSPSSVAKHVPTGYETLIDNYTIWGNKWGLKQLEHDQKQTDSRGESKFGKREWHWVSNHFYGC